MNPKIILLVEDNPSDVELTRRALGKSRVPSKMVVAEDGQEALAYLFSGDPPNELPALILLDLKLPKVDGLQVLRQVRAHERARHLPVVVLTTSSEQQDIEQSYALGANSYIRKPVDFTQFAETLQHVSIYWLEMNVAPLLQKKDKIQPGKNRAYEINDAQH